MSPEARWILTSNGRRLHAIFDEPNMTAAACGTFIDGDHRDETGRVYERCLMCQRALAVRAGMPEEKRDV